MSGKRSKPKTPALAAGVSPRALARKAVPTKQPALEQLGLAEDGYLRVRFNHTDRGGPWCLSAIDREDHLLLLEKIESLEAMMPLEVFKGYPGKDYPTAGLPNQVALERLVELRYDDRDQISAIRVTGEKRLWGFRQGRDFSVLWWDPRHEVFPSTLKHT